MTYIKTDSMKWVITINKLNKLYLIFFCKSLCTFWFDNLCQIIYWYQFIWTQFVLRFVRIYCVICETKTRILFWLFHLSFYNLLFLIIAMVSSTFFHLKNYILPEHWQTAEKHSKCVSVNASKPNISPAELCKDLCGKRCSI